jgi:hypothetical protein
MANDSTPVKPTIVTSEDGAVRIEDGCTFAFQGREFTSGGYVETPDHLIGYLKAPDGGKECVDAVGDVTTWAGDKVGRYRITSRWRTPRSVMSGHMNQVRIVVGGKSYTGRSGGAGMIVKAKRCK